MLVANDCWLEMINNDDQGWPRTSKDKKKYLKKDGGGRQ
jgi:hypothetical protein